jgi:glycosyltransferase involved in cell wall biosynthesis
VRAVPRVLFGVTVPVTALAFLRDQMSDLAERGWDVHLATSPDPGFEHLVALPGVTVHPLPMKRDPDPASDLRSLLHWRRLIREIRPDIVVASTPKAGLLGMLAARQQNVPLRLYHVRGLRAEGLSGAVRRISLASERAAVWAATDVLCDSESLRDEMRALGLLQPDQGIVLGAGSCCGVDTAFFRPPSPEERSAARQALGAGQHEVVIGFVGRLATDKGVLDLLSAVRDLHATDRTVRLALVGPPEDDALAGPIAGATAQGWAFAPGAVADPRPSYWAFDLFCLPSRREGFPISPLEAQACGLPVVTTTATGCRDSVVDGTTGLLVPPADVPALHSALASLTDDSDRRTAMGRAAEGWVRASFEQSDVRGRFIAYLERLAQSAPSAEPTE